MGMYLGEAEVKDVISGLLPVEAIKPGGSDSWQRGPSPDGEWDDLVGSTRLEGSTLFIESTGSSPNGVLSVIDVGEADGAVNTYLEHESTVNNLGVALRVVDENNYIFIRRNASFGQGAIGTVINGVSTVQSIGGLSRRFSVEVSGSTATGGTVVTAFSNGEERASITFDESIFDGVTRHGVYYPSNPANTPEAGWREWQWYTPGETLGGGWESWGGSSWRIERDIDRLPNGTISVGDGTAHRFATGGDPLNAVAVRDTGHSNGMVRVKLDPSNRVRIIFRALDSDNYLYFRMAELFSDWQLFQRVDGDETLLKSFPGSVGAGTIVEIYFYENMLRFRTGSSFSKVEEDQQTYILTGDALSLNGGTRHGFGHENNHAEGEGPTFQSWSFHPHYSFAVAGSSLMSIPSQPWIGRQVDVFQAPLPTLGQDDAVAVMWGVNDAISMSHDWFAKGLETTISRITSITETHIDARSVYPREGTWTDVSGTLNNSGDGWLESSDVGATMTYSIPEVWPGGTMAICFVAISGGGTAELIVDGGTPISVPTDRGQWGFEPLFAERIHLPAGAHEVKVRVASGTIAVDSIWAEDFDTPLRGGPPRVAVANVARFLHGADFTATAASPTTVSFEGANWGIDEHVGATARIYEGPGSIQDRDIVSNTSDTITIDTPWSTVPVPGQSRIHVNQVGSPWGNITDKKVEDMNEAIAGVVSKFPNAALVDIDTLIDRSPVLLGADGIHPSVEGHEALGREFARVIDGRKIVQGRVVGPRKEWESLWIFGHSYAAGTGGGSHGFGYQLPRFLKLKDAVVDTFYRPGVRGTNVLGHKSSIRPAY